MSSQRLDLVIFGASGYTGRFVIKELRRILTQYPHITWAVAGRSREKLEIAVGGDNENDGRPPVRVIVADTKDNISLHTMCAEAKIVINCCGPYYLTGEAVVRAAIESKTHYIDVCSEPIFLDLVRVKYEKLAREAGVFVINACGMGCVPVDLGVLYLEQNFKGTLNSVEAYLVTDASGESAKRWPANVLRNTTYEAAIYEIAHGTKIPPPSTIAELQPQLKSHCLPHKRFNRWCTPHPGAEETVVERTQQHLNIENNKRPVQFKRYHSHPSILASISTTIGKIMLWIVCRIFCLTSFMIRHPRLCSLGVATYGDPDESFMRLLSFEYKLVGVGWKREPWGQPGDEITARVYALGENAPYEGTAVAVIFCAITLLTERNKMTPTGGVLTTGAAFRNTSIIKKLNDDKLKFEIINKS